MHDRQDANTIHVRLAIRIDLIVDREPIGTPFVPVLGALSRSIALRLTVAALDRRQCDFIPSEDLSFSSVVETRFSILRFCYINSFAVTSLLFCTLRVLF